MLGNRPLQNRVGRRKSVTKTQYYALEGGLDIVTPALSVKPGRALAMVNFEPWYQGGYRRIPGYERFDGRPRPSDASYTGFEVDTVAGLTLRDVITGDTSGATGVLVGIYDDDGTIGSDWIAVTKVVGTFQNAEPCNSAAFTIDSVPAALDSPTLALGETFLLEAEDDYRDDIAVVPGEAQVRGVWQRNADVFAIRNDVGSNFGIIHLATTSGWATGGITMAEYIRFDVGLAAGASVAVGDTVTGGTSGATATIHKIVLNGGSVAWDSSGEGYLVLTGVAGGPFQNNEKLESPALTNIADADGVNTAFTLSDGGVYRFVNHNFYGGASTFNVYGCNGIDPGFEIDEANIVSPILMPTNPLASLPGSGIAPTNTPFLVEEHRGHLFFAFEGGSCQHSIPGDPLNFQAFLGAGELGLGGDITSINSVVGNVLVLSTRRETRGLFGTGVADWELRIIAEQSGSLLFGSQKIDTVYSIDDLGITSVARSDQFGDFINATVSADIQPIINAARPNFTDSSIVRESNQFRLYFNDNSGVIMYVPAGSQSETRRGRTTQQIAQFGFLSYDIPVTQIYNTEDATGKERSYFVTADATWLGYVFEDQIGKNFDGEEIAAYVRTPFNQVGSPAYLKRFRRADLELNAPQQLSIQFASDLTYGSAQVSSGLTDITVSDISEIDVFGGGSFWDSVNWDEFEWDGQTIATARANLTGTGENVSFLVFNETAKASAWVMQGITLHYDMRRLQR